MCNFFLIVYYYNSFLDLLNLKKSSKINIDRYLYSYTLIFYKLTCIISAVNAPFSQFFVAYNIEWGIIGQDFIPISDITFRVLSKRLCLKFQLNKKLEISRDSFVDNLGGWSDNCEFFALVLRCLFICFYRIQWWKINTCTIIFCGMDLVTEFVSFVVIDLHKLIKGRKCNKHKLRKY